VKIPLGLWEGSTENKTVTSELLSNLVHRGLDVEQGVLVVIDGSKALRAAVNDVLGARTPVQRCQIHKQRNVLDHLADRDRDLVKRRLRRAWAESDYERALEQLQTLASELERSHPGAAASLREGMAETLTVTRLGVKGSLRKTLASTNPCESMIECVRRGARNVKYWQNGEMCYAGPPPECSKLSSNSDASSATRTSPSSPPASSAKSPFTSPPPPRPGRPLSSPPRSHITPGPPPKFHTVRDILASLGWSHRLTIDECEVGFICLNSAWRAYGGEEDFQLMLVGERQFAQNLDRLAESAAVRIVVLHHPLDWLARWTKRCPPASRNECADDRPDGSPARAGSHFGAHATGQRHLRPRRVPLRK